MLYRQWLRHEVGANRAESRCPSDGCQSPAENHADWTHRHWLDRSLFDGIDQGAGECELKQVHFMQGNFVRKGDLLFTLDARPFQAALKQPQASLARDKAQAALDEVQAQRYEKLYNEGVAPKEQYDQTKAAADAQEAAVHADGAAMESAKLQLQYC
jgi:hypothetical protein